MFRARRSLAVVAGAAVAVGLLAPAVSAAPSTSPVQPLPTSMASLGDSITRGFNACGFYVDCTRRSWSTGDEGDVASHRVRLLRLGAELNPQVNLARSGSRAEHLAPQAEQAVEAGADYVTVAIGANDACRSSVPAMTSVPDFSRHVDTALGLLADGLPQTRVFIASIPDLYRLWEIGHRSWYVRYAWSRLGACQSMLARPASTEPADRERRAEVRQRVRAYNTVLERACARYGPNCRFDGGAVFDTRFERGQVSNWDFFHPNAEGQRVLAEVTWEAGFFAGAGPIAAGAAAPAPGRPSDGAKPRA